MPQNSREEHHTQKLKVELKRESLAPKACCFVCIQCAVPENIHSPATEGIGISWVVGEFCKAKTFKEIHEACLIGISRREGGLRKKSFLWERYGYFLEYLHNL